MGILNRAQVDLAQDLPRELVSVPEWGGDVYVRVLSVGERLRLEAMMGKEPKADTVLRLLSMSLCGEDGKSLYGEDGLEDLKRKGDRALFRLQDVAVRLNQLGADQGGAEDVAKN